MTISGMILHNNNYKIIYVIYGKNKFYLTGINIGIITKMNLYIWMILRKGIEKMRKIRSEEVTNIEKKRKIIIGKVCFQKVSRIMIKLNY